MPRPRVTDRKRVLKACTNCKRRKEKCDGFHPCGRCQHRSRERDCSFLEDTPSTGTRNKASLTSYSREASFERGGSSIPSEPLQDVSRRIVEHGDVSGSNSATSAPVQELPVRTTIPFRLFYNSHLPFLSRLSGVIVVPGHSRFQHTPELLLQ